jgi:phospholipid N-methyltransferase
MRHAPSDYRLFFREFLTNFHTTGAILPSGRRLAATLARYVGHGAAPQRILEVGPGTGAVTRHILAALGPQDTLDLVELNRAFVRRLRRRLRNDPLFQPAAGRIRVVQAAVQELPGDGVYDLIISGLPLNNFTPELVAEILNALFRLLAPGGTLSFFQYIAVRRLRSLVSGPAQRRRLKGIGRVLEGALAGEFRREWVWPNVPPAWVHHLRTAKP